MIRNYVLVTLFTCMTHLGAIAQNGYWTVSAPPAATVSLVGASGINIRYFNYLRFDPNAKNTSTPIGSATIPALLAATPSSQSTPTAPAAPAARPAPEAAPELNKQGAKPRPVPKNGTQTETKQLSCPTDPGTVSDQATALVCWNHYRDQIDVDRVGLMAIRDSINTLIREVAGEQACYQAKLILFSHPILVEREATALVAFAQGNSVVIPKEQLALPPNSCHREGAEAWPFRTAQSSLDALNLVQDNLNRLSIAPGFLEWLKTAANSAANTALSTQLANLISEGTAYTTGNVSTGAGSVVTQTYNDMVKVDLLNQQWRARLASIQTIDSLRYIIDIERCHEWYGKGRKDTITLTATDLSSGAGVTTTISLATNTCNPLSIASTGIGVSFLANPTYAFVATNNTNAQVIGVTAQNDRLPLYALMYHVSISGSHWDKPVEFFGTAGVGLTSSSSSTTGDFLAGLSVSLGRRSLFLTPALDFGQRTGLAPGFTLNTTPQGSLTAVPTVTNWKPGFVLAISFGISPSS